MEFQALTTSFYPDDSAARLGSFIAEQPIKLLGIEPGGDSPPATETTPQLPLTELDWFDVLPARDLDSFTAKISTWLSMIGVDHFALHGATAAQALHPFGTFPDEFIDRYAAEGFHRYDPVLANAITSSARREVIFLEDVRTHIERSPYSSEANVQNLALCELMDRFELGRSCGIYIHNPDIYQRAILRLSFNDQVMPKIVVRKSIESLLQLAIVIPKIGAKKYRKAFRNNSKVMWRVGLSYRQLQLLECLDKDLTLNEAAEVLNISISTANQHVAAAKKALQAETTHGMLNAARKQGYLFET